MHHSWQQRPGRPTSRQQRNPPPSVDQWIMNLSNQELISRLRELGANTEGSLLVLRDRLSRAGHRSEFNVTWLPEDNAQPYAVGQGTSAETSIAHRDPSIIHASTTGAPVLTTTTTTTTTYTTAGQQNNFMSFVSTVQMNSRSVSSPVAQTSNVNMPRRDSFVNNPPPMYRNVPNFASTQIESPLRANNSEAYRDFNLNQVEEEHTRYNPAMFERVNAWKISFSGAANESVESFVNKLEQCRLTCGLTEIDIFRAIPPLLTGAASNWWAHKRLHVNNYNEFIAQLRRRFGIASEQCRILGEIVSRTQGRYEKGMDYLDCIQSMWLRTQSSIPLENRLDFAFNNLRPEYHTDIRRERFRTFEELEELVLIFDSCRSRPEHRPPPALNDSILPECAYDEKRYIVSAKKHATQQVSIVDQEENNSHKNRGSRRSGKARGENESKGSGQPPSNSNGRKSTQGQKEINTTSTAPAVKKKSPRKPVDDSELICHNCKEKGHRFTACKKERTALFCYRCGESEVITKNCPKCIARKQARRSENPSGGQT